MAPFTSAAPLNQTSASPPTTPVAFGPQNLPGLGFASIWKISRIDKPLKSGNDI
jgi:hypothetical protein